jgi:hypothetical protein
MPLIFARPDLPTAAIARGLLPGMLLAFISGVACGADEEEARAAPPGLPAGLDWSFNFDATLGAFGFADSLYTDPKPEQPSGDLSDNWFEGSIKPALSAQHTTGKSGQLYAKVSAVGARTYGAAPTLVGADASSFDVEDLHIGWRSGTRFESLGEDALDFTFGRTRYELGHGMLLWDGAADGGTRGGYWTGARKAFETAAIGRFKPGAHTLEAFYLDKDDVPEADSHSKLCQGALLRSGIRRGGQRRRARLDRVECSRRVSIRRCVETQAVVSLCPFRGRRSAHLRERSLRFAVHRLLGLGLVVAGRNRRRILRREFQSHFAPVARAGGAERVHRDRVDLL